MNSSNISTVKEFSAGGIVLDSIDDDASIILICRKKQIGDGIVWCLPKGKIEKNENAKEAALREVKEETGVKARIIKEIDKVNYWYYKTKTIRCYKTVYFYMMKQDSGKISTGSLEVEDVRWFKFDEAISTMSYDSEIDMVKKAREELGKL